MSETESMTKVSEFERTHEEACEQEGHLMYEDANSKYCLRCPFEQQ